MVRRVNGAKMYSRYFYEFNSLSERVKNTFQLQKRLKNDPKISKFSNDLKK